MCSIGLAPNKLLAKIASDLDKPDGFCVLTPEGMLDAVGDRPASLIPGVGPKTVERLRRAGVRTVAELAARRRRARHAPWGRGSAPSCGRARTGSTSGPWRPSASASRRAPRRRLRRTSPTPAGADETLDRLSARVCEGLGRGGYRGRTVTVKVRLRPFRTFTRSQTLEATTRDAAVVRAAGARAARPRGAGRAGAPGGRRAVGAGAGGALRGGRPPVRRGVRAG